MAQLEIIMPNIPKKKYNVYVINLRNRSDRWGKINTHIKNKSKILELNKFVALEGKPSWKYCALSHIELVKKAKLEGMPYIIVMEDDNIIMIDNFDTVFESIMNILIQNKSKWDIFNGNPSWCKMHKTQHISLFSQSPRLVSYSFGKTANFVIYNSSSYDKIISLEKLYQSVNLYSSYKDLAYDRRYCNIGLRFITRLPYLTNQTVDYSNIDGKVVNHQGQIINSGQIYLAKKLIN